MNRAERAGGSRLPNKLKSALKQVKGNQQEHSAGHQGNIGVSEGLSMPTDHSRNAGSAEAEAEGNRTRDIRPVKRARALALEGRLESEQTLESTSRIGSLRPDLEARVESPRRSGCTRRTPVPVDADVIMPNVQSVPTGPGVEASGDGTADIKLMRKPKALAVAERQERRSQADNTSRAASLIGSSQPKGIDMRLETPRRSGRARRAPLPVDADVVTPEGKADKRLSQSGSRKRSRSD